MEYTFVELPAFERHRDEYLHEDNFQKMQEYLLKNPEAGDLVPGLGGLRKVRWTDQRRSKGKRGGVRIIYYLWDEGSQIWLFTLFNKDELDDLPEAGKKIVRGMLEAELKARLL